VSLIFCEKCGFRLKPPEQELKPAAGQDAIFVKQQPNNTTNNMTETPETKKQKEKARMPHGVFNINTARFCFRNSLLYRRCKYFKKQL